MIFGKNPLNRFIWCRKTDFQSTHAWSSQPKFSLFYMSPIRCRMYKQVVVAFGAGNITKGNVSNNIYRDSLI
jgi:hypothetical protein